MYTANNESMRTGKNILAFLPREVRKYMYGINLDEAYEIHLRIGKPLTIRYSDGHYFLRSTGILTKSAKGAFKINKGHINEALELVSKSSLYAKTESISEGFITIDGGHRVGICGTAVTKQGRIEFIRDVSSLCYRLACEVEDISSAPAEVIYNGGDIKNTVIISPPGAGKTTLLRSITRFLSYKGTKVCVVDERSEIAAMSDGVPGFDLGPFTDVLNGVKKITGMNMVLRAMSPDVIVTDEMGTSEDIEAAATAINSGTRVVTSIHGADIEQVKRKTGGIENVFDLAIVLSKRDGAGCIESITPLP